MMDMLAVWGGKDSSSLSLSLSLILTDLTLTEKGVILTTIGFGLTIVVMRNGGCQLRWICEPEKQSLRLRLSLIILVSGFGQYCRCGCCHQLSPLGYLWYYCC